MMKGQAFDTFKLMIAAVVAVAILGILLGILGGISTPGQSFDDTAKQLITKATQSPLAVYPSAGKVTFQKDSIFPPAIFLTSSGGLTVKYQCKDASLCTPATAGSTDALKILNNFKSKIYVCCIEDDSCHIGIGQVYACP